MSRALPGLTARATNLSVLAAVVLIFATGVGAVATGSPRGRWVVIAHGVAAIALVFLIPWKAMVMRRGWRRGRATRWVSLLLGILVSGTVVAGLASAAGLVTALGGFETLWWHIAVALGLVPVMLFHLVTRPVRILRLRVHRLPARQAAPTRRPGVRRRAALRLGAVAGLAATTYLAAETLLRLTGAAGARRRFTGSHEVASRDPTAMPATIWLNDHVPAVDADNWRLTVVDAAGRRELRLADLARSEQTVRAILDCTSGWYAEHEWTGVPVSALVTPNGSARSVYVHSVTGYWIRFPVGDIGSLLLATRVGGQTLRPGHGYPVRLVAPGRRGFWWVKWVDRIELDATPAWWRPPLPVT
jgi:DMSO/TMAO reductase YedYZ molybdopterin-dependent catalytic subunit